MIRFMINTYVSKPPEMVNQAFTNPENMPYWTKHLEKFEVVSGKLTKAGALARLHFKRKGKSYIMEEKLLETEPGRRYKSRVSGQGIIAEVETLIEPIENGTKITIRWKGRGKTAPVNLFIHLFRGRIKNSAASELSEFKSLVESQGVKFS